MSPHFILILTLSVLVFSILWKTKTNPLYPFLTFWYLVKLAMRVTHTNIPLTTSIYKKPTHTDRYLHYTSNHPKHQKHTVVQTLFNRVNTHISDNKLKHREQLLIRSTLQLNGFPTRTTFLSPRKACSQDSPYKHFTSIPYVQGTSEKIRKVLNEAGVNVAMRPVHTIRHVLPLPKDPYTSEDIGCII